MDESLAPPIPASSLTPVSHRWSYLFLSLALFTLDQGTKLWVQAAIPYGEGRPLTDWFSIVHWLNNGGLWGSLQDLSLVPRILLFYLLPLAGLGFLLWLFAKSKSRFELALLAVVLGGALGNIADRLRLGAVVDFLDFHIPGGWSWPAFNVADACLSVGICLLLLKVLFEKESTEGGSASHPV